jgi:hypothetical protein
MPRLVPAIAFLAALAACGTPQEQCIARETRDLRVLDRLIVETEGNIARGYAIEEYTVDVSYWGSCLVAQPPDAAGVRPPPLAEPCLQDREVTRTRAKAIDLRAERAKLSSMQEKRRELARAAERAIAQCRVQFPE